jgi:transposase
MFVKAPAGRQRVHILGAINAVTHELLTVTHDSYINAQTIYTLPGQLDALHLEMPITLVLDNARYQKCSLVLEFAASLNIELLYLPSYSPNLNLIERLWKLMKKKCLYSKYYEDFTACKIAMFGFFRDTQTISKSAVSSLLTLHCQTFEESHIINS